MIALKSQHVSPIGLHLSGQTATLMQLAGKPGSREVHAMATCRLPHDENASVEEQDRETTSTLKKLISDHHFKGRHVVSCLGSQELFVQNVRLPNLPPEEVEKVVSWEAEDRLPYPVSDAEIRHLLAGQVRQDSHVKQEVILLACHRGVIQRHVQLLEQTGLIPTAIDVEPCAILRSLRLADSDSDARCAYLSFGDKATTVIITEAEQVHFLKYINTGGHHLDLAVARHLEMNLAEASRIRASVTASTQLDPNDDIHRSVLEAIRGPLESIVDEVELCIRYYKVTFRGKPLSNIVVTGSDASQWMATFLSERCGLPTELRNPFDTLKQQPQMTAIDDSPWRWTTAMGLSMKDENNKGKSTHNTI